EGRSVVSPYRRRAAGSTRARPQSGTHGLRNVCARERAHTRQTMYDFAVTRRRASLALAAIVVVARLVGGAGATTAAAATSDETIRAVPVCPHAPSRAVRSAQSVHA